MKIAIVTGTSSEISEAAACRQEIILSSWGEAATLTRVMSGPADVFFTRYDARVRESLYKLDLSLGMN